MIPRNGPAKGSINGSKCTLLRNIENSVEISVEISFFGGKIKH